MRLSRTLSLFATVAVSVSVGFISGCAGSFDPTPSSTTETIVGSISGTLNGGQSPIKNASIYVYAAGTSGYGGNATLLSTTVPTTSATGTFNLTGDYQCTTGQEVYIVAKGGDAGSGTNSAIDQMAYLGTCGNLVSSVTINEISTVVMAYAVGGFGTSSTQISSGPSTGSQQEMAVAFSMIPVMMNIPGGFPDQYAFNNKNVTIPYAKILALANIVAGCVNTASPTSSQCSKLASDTGSGSTDEAVTVFYMAHNPTRTSANISDLFSNVMAASPPFSGGLTSATQPTDLTLPIVFNGVVGGHANNIAIDAAGNAWIGDSVNNAVVEMTPSGTVNRYTNGGTFGSISNTAVSPTGSGLVWASDSTNDKVYLLNSSGTVVTTVTGGGLNKPNAIAFDRSGNGYVVNTGAYTISEFASTGAHTATATYPAAEGYSTSIAVDYAGNDYTSAGNGVNGIGFLPVGTTTGVFYSGASSAAVSTVALDSTSNTAQSWAQYYGTANNVWTLASNGVIWQVYMVGGGYKATGIQNNSSTYYTGGMVQNGDAPAWAFDGAGNLWVANAQYKSGSYPLSGYKTTTAGSVAPLSTNGYTTGVASTTTTAYAVAPDGCGNVWVANSDGSVSELLGLATPVVTPTLPGYLATKP